NSNVAKKADATALQSLQNTVEQHGRDLTTQSSALTNLENNFSSLAVGGTNLIRNADTLEGWSSRHATETYLGDRVAYTRLAKGASGYTQLDEQTLDVTGRTEFVFSFYAKGAYDGQEMASYFYNPSNTTTTETSQGVKGGAGDGKAVTKLTTAWARYWVKWVIPATSGTKRLIAARLESATSAEKEVWLCRPQLETGTVMTDWSPSPDDAASGITANTSAINSLTSRVTNAEGQLTAQSQSITNLQNSLNTTNNNVAQKASAQSVSDLTSRVTSAEGKITSQGQAITKLQGDLSSTTDKVNTKADQTALNALTGRVEKTEAGLTAANSNIVSLTAAVNAGNAAGDDYIPNPSFDPAYDRMGYDVVETTAAGVPADCPFRYAVRLAGRDHVPKINNIAVTPGDVYEMSALVACGTGSADFNFYIGRATTATGGIGARASGGNTRTTTAWKRATWRFTVPADTNFLRPFLQVNQSSPFGTVWYAADWHMRNVTAANSAQKTADATAKAVDSLTTTVSQQGDTLSSIGTRTTSLENSLRSTNDTVSKKADTTAVTQLQGTVTQQGNDIAAANSALTKLSSDLATTNANVNKKADASAMNTLQNQVTEQGKTLSAQGDSLTQLSNSLSQTAADIDASGKMPGNLIVNGSFERGAAGFTGWSSTATVADLQVPHSGNKALKMSAGQSNLVGQEIRITQGRTYRMGVWAKQDPGTTIKDAGNTKFRVADSTGLLVGSNYGPFSSGWQLVTFDWKATKTTTASFQLTTFLSAGAMYFDDFHVLDVTDEKDIAANAGAISQMNTRVTAAEGAITTQAQQLTKLSSDLATTNANVNKKADASAMNTLQNQVTEQGKTLSAQGDSLTQLSNSLSQTAADIDASGKMPGNLIVNGSFERGAAGFTGWSSTATVADLQVPHSGNKALKMSAGQSNLVGQEIRITQGRTYRMGVWAKQDPGTTIKDAGNTKFRVADSTGLLVGSNYGPFSSGWQLVTFDWKATKTTTASFQLTTFLSAGAMYFDDFHVLDVTDEKDIAANAGAISQMNTRVTAAEGAITTQAQQLTKLSGDLAVTNAAVSKKAEQSAVTGLTTRMTSAEGKLDSQSQQLTSLQNSLTTMNTELGKKADTSAVSSLTGRVSQVENTITSQSQSITSLTSTINTIRTQGANPWVDGTFESYSDGQVLGGNGTAVVVASLKFTGGKSLKLRRDENNSGNSDKQLGTWQSVREDAKFRFEFWAMMPADQAPSSGWTTLVGIQSQNAAGQNAWQAAVTVSEASLGARDKWVKFTGIASNNGAGRTRAVVWISTRGATGNGTPGYSLYIDDLVITDVTDAKAAQDASDATASAVSGLTARVTDAEGKITAQAQQQTALATKVDNANSRVDNMAKTLSDSQSTQASLNTSLQSQIDAQAAANIKNQTTLDNTIKSVASITSTQQTHATALEALATQQTTLTSSVGDLSASVQNTAKTVADVNGTVSSLWSMKVETVNGKNVGAGITLGSNGETSDMILYADRFSLFNRNNATAVPVMVAEGNELYIDTARIKNSSLTSAKIADGSITNAKIGNEIRSNDFVDGSRGWRIAKDGSSQFNNVIVRGAVYATDGWFQGTVYANHIEGDIGSFAINIAQHRTRKVPKATWQWFELARFRRQNFDQVINIRGGLLQTDSITIDGGAKLRAGMSYAPGADGGLNPGYLSYAMLLRGTGATSGGGSMELGIELMYETGGATRLLTAQESMNVDNMSFVVPAGTGDAVLRYGCYLDRNGQMVLTILSRFDAFAARNNNVIRAASSA
ncbi:phage tail tip fiber protein, partial [Klebsiella pneumoniae]